MAKYKKLALAILFSFCCVFSASLFLHSEKFTQVFGAKEEKNIVLLVPQASSRAGYFHFGKYRNRIFSGYSQKIFLFFYKVFSRTRKIKRVSLYMDYS